MTLDWAAGQATRESARRAARWGGIACLIFAALILLGTLVISSYSGKPLDDAIVWTLGASIIPVVIGLAGIAQQWEG